MLKLTGDCPGLFESEELEKVINATRPAAKEAGIAEHNRDAIFGLFVGRVRAKLHLVLCMSPVGDAFRRRCRMFPSLVNCCSIDWFSDWPQEALVSVAVRTLSSLGNPETVHTLANVCMLVHQVNSCAPTFGLGAPAKDSIGNRNTWVYVVWPMLRLSGARVRGLPE